MKRTPFKTRKTPLRASQGLRKASRQPISKLQRLVWEECKRVIRSRHGNVCYTCGKTGLKGSDWHTGHMWPKAALGAYMKYDLRILRPQCYHCNINLGGNGAAYYAKMLSEIGPDAMRHLESERQIQTKAYDHYAKILEQYRTI